MSQNLAGSLRSISLVRWRRQAREWLMIIG